MKKLITALALCLSALTVEKASAECYSDCFSRSSLELKAGYRTDDLNFRIGCNLESPDTLSKVNFDDIRIYQFGATLRTTFCECVYFRGDARVGQIYSGKSRVTNFFNDCSGNNVERFHRDMGRGEVWDLSGGVGYQFCACDTFRITPLIGYSSHEQRIHRFGPVHGFINDWFFEDDSRFCNESSSSCSSSSSSEQIAKSSGNCCFGDLKCVSSRYRARWNGPWLGLDIGYQVNCALDFYGSFEYHWAHFNGKGRWNWNDEFIDDFHQSANGDGQTYTFGLNYHYWDCFDFGAEVQFQQWRTRRGRDRAYINGDGFGEENSRIGQDCATPTTLYNRLNYVKWDSFSISLTTAYMF